MGGVIYSTYLSTRSGLDDSEEDLASTDEADNSSSLTFSQNHGKNLQLSKGGLVARRLPGGFCNAIVFTNQPITPYGFKMRLNKVAHNWSGFIRVGFTSKDPSRINPKSLPKSLVPDLCAKKGFWAKSLDYENFSSGDIINVWIDSTGLAKYTVNSHLPGNEACRVFLEKLPIADYLWVVFDVYGNCTEIELLPTKNEDSVFHWPASHITSPTVAGAGGDECCSSSAASSLMSSLTWSYRRLHSVCGSHELSLSTAASLMTNNFSIRSGSNIFLPDDLFDIYFHKISGSKIKFSKCQTIAVRDPDSYHDGNVFINSPLLCNRTYLFVILDKAERCLGNLRIGVTDCNPNELIKEGSTWPSDSLDFEGVRETEFWHVCQMSENCNIGDVVAVYVAKSMHSNAKRVVMFNVIRPNVSQGYNMQFEWKHLCDVPSGSGQLWLLIDLFGKANSIGLIGMTAQIRPESSGNEEQTEGAAGSNSECGEVERSIVEGGSVGRCHCKAIANPLECAQNGIQDGSSPTCCSDPIDLDTHNPECAVCMQNNSDTVIYDCGHCCLCYNCAHDLLRLKHHCPICRRPIKDVIKVFYG